MTFIFRAITVFFLLIVATGVSMDVFKTEYGTVDFWDRHGVFFLLFITFFPRLTLLFSSVAFGGVLWWLGFFFMPRVLVASLATVAYFHTNPVLVVFAWLVAFGGEVFEKWGIAGKNKFVIRTYRNGPVMEEMHEGGPVHIPKGVADKGDVIEAEFTKK